MKKAKSMRAGKIVLAMSAVLGSGVAGAQAHAPFPDRPELSACPATCRVAMVR